MNIKDFYTSIGGNFENVLGRLTKESLVEKFALMYLKDSSFQTLMEAIATENIPESFRAAHSLKGVSANLGFEELSKAASNLTEQLRPQNKNADPSLVDSVRDAHQKIIAGLQEYQK